MRIVPVLIAIMACAQEPGSRFKKYPFNHLTREPAGLSHETATTLAELGRLENEHIVSMSVRAAPGLGQSVVYVVVEDGENTRSYVVDEDANIFRTQEFAMRENTARNDRYGRMTPELYAAQEPLSEEDTIEVSVAIVADVPEPQRPYDGTDMYVPIEEFEEWTRQHAIAQTARIAAAKERVVRLLERHGTVTENFHAMPGVRARVSVELLRSADLNAADVIEIAPSPPWEDLSLHSYAGRASMAGLGPLADHPSSPFRSGLYGGVCGGLCDGNAMDVGIWEGTEPENDKSGIARNNQRISANNVLTGYLHCPKVCNSDSDCPTLGTVSRRCQPPTTGAQKVCVQNHLTWVAGSIGMFGSYGYSDSVPAPDPSPNVPAATSVFGSTGAWDVDHRVGNIQGIGGLNFLVSPPPATEPCQQVDAPPTPYVNRSQDLVEHTMVNAAARAFGTFVVASSGNVAGGPAVCARLMNGLCVGGYDYRTYDDMTSHLRTPSSSFQNALGEVGLERPHLLGPGSHSPGSGAAVTSGLHLPAIEFSPPTTKMRNHGYLSGTDSITGTSFAAPTVLSIAIQAHQHEGWLSALAFPVVNKAVLLASTRDANNDGAIGKANTWSANAPTVDAEDGAGQIRLDKLKQILDSNQYRYEELSDAAFVSCGANCRAYYVASVLIPATKRLRVALAWQLCIPSGGSAGQLVNDLDLALSCGPVISVCGGTSFSNSIDSEVEMIERNACSVEKSCTIEVRIKNGEALLPCGSVATERAGVAWSIHN